MINRPGSSPARRSFRKDSRAEKHVLLEAGHVLLVGPFNMETKRVLPAVHPNGLITGKPSKYCFRQIVGDSRRFECPERRNVQRERAREARVRKPRPLRPHELIEKRKIAN
ncbi:hypothetical protein EVAR_16892_1 [Eumeta japonica]|uniref:Uncharacterized protein n=1 Tax=Eumeta variegata TaxID=151549 RepID=A0A4C1TVC5_EUMVA|nr:hypothetical protein EVAR_16892_1 [Eumeta japonica]